MLGGCRFGAPLLEDLGGCPGCGGSACAPDTKTKAILRQQARNAREQERFIDQYFFNYDIHDPYRGDCLSGW
jgi:hypothetical protein